MELTITDTHLNTMNSDVMMWMWDTFAIIGIILNVLSLIFYISQTTGLYLINKKLGEKHAWLSFIPLLQIYNYFTASQKWSLHYFWLPIISMFVAGLLITPTFGISLIIAYIYVIIMFTRLLHAISIRCGRWVWTTIGFLFVPFIMMPVVGYKLKYNTQNTWSETLSKEKQETVEL